MHNTLDDDSVAMLLETQQRLEALLSSSFDAIIAIDSNKKIIKFNRQAEVLLGYTESELIGKSVERLHEEKKKAREIYYTIKKNGKIERAELVLVHKDGSRIPVLLSGKLIADEGGNILGQVGFIRDLRESQLFDKRMKALVESSKAVNSTSEIREILECVIKSALLSIPSANRGSIYFHDEISGKLVLMISSFDYSRKEYKAQNFAVGEGIIGWVYERQQPIISGNVQENDHYISYQDTNIKPPRSMLCAPITSKERKIGVMCLSHTSNKDMFTPQDLELMIGFADQAAIAINNAEQVKKITKEAEELDFLQSISLKINSQVKIDEILKVIVEGGMKLLGTQMAVVHWKGREQKIIKTFVAPKELQELMTRPRETDGLTAEVFQNGGPIVIHDTACDTRVNPQVREVGIKSLVGYPLHLGGRVAGVIFFNSQQRQFFGEHEIHLISLLLPLAAAAIENTNTIEHLERTKQLSESLMEVSSKLAATNILIDQMAAVKRFIQENLGAQMFFLGLYDGNNNVINLLINCEDGKDLPLFPVPVKNQEDLTISSFVVKKRRSILWYTEKQKYDACKELGIIPLQKGMKCQTCLAFPLEVEGNVLGVISIQSTEPYAWDDIEVSIFQTLAHQASIAIRNAQLNQESMDSFDRLQKSYEASEKIISELEPDQALDVLVSSICTAFGAFRACAVLVNEMGSPYHVSKSGFDADFDLGEAFRKEGISSQVYRSGQPEFFEDVRRYAGRVNPNMITHNSRSAACLPLTYKNNKLGVLWVHYCHPRHFQEREKEALRLFTNQAAIAYENARLYRQINRARDTAMKVAEVTALGNLKNTLDSVVKGLKDVLDCDIVTLWTYWQEKDEFDYMPATAGEVRYPRQMIKTKNVPRDAVPFKVIAMDDIYVAEETQKDTVLNSPFAIRENVTSSAALPLKTHDRRVGALFINYCNQNHTFTKEELTNIRLFSSQAAVAISNAMLFEHEQKQREVLNIINRAGRTVTSHLKIDDIIGVLAFQAYRLTGKEGKRARFATITLVEGNRTYVQAAYPKSEMKNILEANIANVDLDKGLNGRIGIVGRAVITKAPILVKVVDEHPDFLRSNEQTKSELAVPIIYQKTVIGVINVEHDDVNGLDEEDLHDIQALAAHAAVAIQNARIFQDLERKNQHQMAIYEASKIINASIDLTETELLKLLVEQMVTRIIPKAGALNILGAVQLYNAEKNELQLECTYPEEAFGVHKIGETRSLAASTNGKIGISGRAVVEKKPQREDDVRHNQDYYIYSPDTKSELDVPMLVGDDVLGVLSIECNQLNGYDKDAEDTLSAFAKLSVIAIKNIRRYQELKETRAMVGNITAVAWMGLVAGAWRHAIGNMSTTISDLSILVDGDLDRGEPAKLIKTRLEKIREIVDEIQDIPMPPLSSESGVENIYICQLVRDRINQFKNKKSRYGNVNFEMQFQVEELVMVRASPEWLRRILDILIDNAVNSMRACHLKRINTKVCIQNESVEILISDTGSGIPENVRSILFKKPILKKKGEKGSGIGLFLANTIIQVYGGRLEICDTGADGTTVAMWLPLLREK